MQIYWETGAPFLFGRYRINGSLEKNDPDCVITMIVRPGQRVDWEVSPPGAEETTSSGTVGVESTDKEAIEEAKARAVAALESDIASLPECCEDVADLCETGA